MLSESTQRSSESGLLGGGKSQWTGKYWLKCCMTLSLVLLQVRLKLLKNCNYVSLHGHLVLIRILHNNHLWIVGCSVFGVLCVPFLLLLLYDCFIDRFKSDIFLLYMCTPSHHQPIRSFMYHKNCTAGTLDLIIIFQCLYAANLTKFCAIFYTQPSLFNLHWAKMRSEVEWSWVK